MNLRELYERLETMPEGDMDSGEMPVFVSVDGDWWAPVESVELEGDNVWISISVNRSQS